VQGSVGVGWEKEKEKERFLLLSLRITPACHGEASAKTDGVMKQSRISYFVFHVPNSKLQTQNPEPKTIKLQTSNPKPQTPNFKPAFPRWTLDVGRGTNIPLAFCSYSKEIPTGN